MVGVLFACCPLTCSIIVFCISFLMNMLLTLLQGPVVSFFMLLISCFPERWRLEIVKMCKVSLFLSDDQM